MKKILLIIMMLLGHMTMQGQTQQWPIVCIDGLKLDTFYTDAQIRTVLGEPTEFSTWDDEFGGGRIYVFGPRDRDVTINYEANEGIVYFYTNNPQYRLFGRDLHIGDNISKITSKFGLLEPVPKHIDEYRLYPRGFVSETYWNIYTDSNGNITDVSLTVPN